MIKTQLPSMREEAFFELLGKVIRRLCTVSQSALNPQDQTMYQLSCCYCCFICRLYDSETRTIQGLVGMEDFRAHGGQERLDTLIRAIIAHMDASKGECEAVSNAYVSLIRGLPFPSFPIFMTAFFLMVGDACKASSCDKCPAIGASLQLLVRHAPSGILCIFLTEIFRQLEKATEPVLSLLVDTLADLLLSNRGPLGYTALDISSNLMKLLRKQRPPAPPDTRRSILQPTTTGPPRAVFAISNCLGTPSYLIIIQCSSFDFEEHQFCCTEI